MKKRYKVLIAILAILVIVRLALPTIVKNYLNDLLENIEGYTGHVEDVDLALYRGAYRIDSLAIYSTTQDLGRPFFATDAIDLSLSWSDIFKGKIVGKVILEQPQLNFVAVQSEEDTMATGENVDWTEQIKSLLPISINLFQIKNGRVEYLDDFSEPKVDIYLRSINFSVENIRNTDDDTNPLPSPYSLSAVSIGEGNLNATGKANLLKELPDFDLDLKFEKADLTAFNEFFKAYAWFDFERGDFNLYSEMALVDSTLEGYVKPLLNDVKVLDWKNEEEGFFNKVYQGIVGGATEVLENQREDQTATRVEISGTISNSSVGVFSSIVELLKNAFIKPLQKDLEKRIVVRGRKIIDENKSGKIDKPGKKKKSKKEKE